MKKYTLIVIAILLSAFIAGCSQFQSVADQEPDATYVAAEERAIPTYESYAVWEEIELENIPTVNLK